MDFVEGLSDVAVKAAYRDMDSVLRHSYDPGWRMWQEERLERLRDEMVGRGFIEEPIRTVGRPGRVWKKDRQRWRKK